MKRRVESKKYFTKSYFKNQYLTESKNIAGNKGELKRGVRGRVDGKLIGFPK